jgi:hypothetical protein
VLIEATRTHSGLAKPLYYEVRFTYAYIHTSSSIRGSAADAISQLNKGRFADFADKIIHVVVDDLPQDKDPWKLEKYAPQDLPGNMF